MQKKENQLDVPRYYAEAEAVVQDILQSLGCDVEQDISGWLAAWLNGRRYDVCVVVSNECRVSKERIRLGQRKNGQNTLHIVVGVISDELRQSLPELYPYEIVLDLRNLLYFVRSNGTLRSRLVSLLNFSVDGVTPLDPGLDGLAHSGGHSRRTDMTDLFEGMRKRPASRGIDTEGSWDRDVSAGNGSAIDPDFGNRSSEPRKRLEDFAENGKLCSPGRSDSAKYESFCCKVLKELFADDLALWREQQKSDGGLFRFDLVCKIKRGNSKDFWEVAERYFNSKYIVFEFKNYSGYVTQKEVFTTVRYLYAKALRGIAVIISPNGTDAHADLAIRGILRDEGKLILSLSHEDLRNMLNGQSRGIAPADYLSDKLDNLLIDLEK